VVVLRAGSLTTDAEGRRCASEVRRAKMPENGKIKTFVEK
jgi:hypothetical protein